MGFTRTDKAELIDIIKETFNSMSEEIAIKITDSVTKNIEQKIIEVFANYENKIAGLEKENNLLRNEIDTLEQDTRRNSIRIFGIPERDNEDTLTMMKSFLSDKLKLPQTANMIDRCHRIRSHNFIASSSNKSAPIIVKFSSYLAKDQINKSKKLLKGSGISISDDLTKKRYDLYREAVKKGGQRYTWHRDGKIFINYKGNRTLIRSLDDLKKLV